MSAAVNEKSYRLSEQYSDNLRIGNLGTENSTRVTGMTLGDDFVVMVIT